MLCAQEVRFPGFRLAVLVTGAQRAFAFFKRGVAMEQSSPRFTQSVRNVPLCIFEDGSGTQGMPQSSCTILVNAVGWSVRLGRSFSWVHGWVEGTQGHPGTPGHCRHFTLVQRSPKACWTNVPYCLEPRICYRTVPTGPNRISTETKSELCFGGSFPAFADDTFAVFRFLLVEFLCMFPDSGDFLRIELATLN